MRSTVFQFARSRTIFADLLEQVIGQRNVDLLMGANVTGLECSESGTMIEEAAVATLAANRALLHGASAFRGGLHRS